MSDDRLEVIRGLLAKPLITDLEVLRFMVEVRKNVENLKHRYTVLEFFADWLVHSYLDRGSAKTVIQNLDRIVGEVQMAGGRPTQAQIDELGPLISFRLLQRDIAAFLIENGLDGSLVTQKDRFLPFFEGYIDLITRTPLKAKDLNLRYVDRITISKSLVTLGPPAPLEARFKFRIVWKLYKGQNQTGEIASEIWDDPSALPRIVSIGEERTDPTAGTVAVVGLDSRVLFPTPHRAMRNGVSSNDAG